VFGSTGAPDAVLSSAEGGGILRLKVSCPPRDLSRCGGFYSVNQDAIDSLFLTPFNYLGGIESRKIWVILHDNILHCYVSPFITGASGLIRKIDRSTIMNITDINITILGVEMDALKIVVLTALGQCETLTWAWENDCVHMRRLWTQALRPMCKESGAMCAPSAAVNSSASIADAARDDSSVSTEEWGGASTAPKTQPPPSARRKKGRKSSGREVPAGRQVVVAVNPTPVARNIDLGWRGWS
jgi:hypothetical protein